MKDKLDITLRIGNVMLNLTIRPDEEAMLRGVAKEVNRAYESLQERFSGSPEDETMAKVTLLFAKGYLNLSAQVHQTEELLGNFENQLDLLLEDRQ